jgi:hypothetical protein
MPRPYSEDLRLRVVHAAENGKTTREVAWCNLSSELFLCLKRPSVLATDRPRSPSRRRLSASLLEPYKAALSEQLSNSPCWR